MIDLNTIRAEIIGNDTFFESPYGKRMITYADYTASGKTLFCIEKYLLKIQEVYANTHTEDSFTGKTMTGLMHKALDNIKQMLNASNNYLIPVGTGTTGAIAKLSEILGLYLTPSLKYHIDQLLNKDERYKHELIEDMFKKMSEKKPVIFVSAFEHHSNYLMWKESFAEVVEIKMDHLGYIDLNDLENKLTKDYKDRVKIGSFSAASNVTGIITDVYKIASLFHQHNGLIFFDFAASGPYVEINMNKDENAYFDAIFLSPHKFIGGPGSSGILVINKDLYNHFFPPTVSGGGTVEYVNSFFHHYLSDVEAREKAGTPGILQILKTSLAMQFKNYVSVDRIESIEKQYLALFFKRIANNPNIHIYGPQDVNKRLSIVSFNIRYKDKYLHHKFVSCLLNDLFGIQSRAGCACAGPYAHLLLDIDRELAQRYQKVIKEGMNVLRPGFVRVNFHYLMTIEEVNFIIDALEFVAKYGYLFLAHYGVNFHKGEWEHLYHKPNNLIIENFGIKDCLNRMEDDPFIKNRTNKCYEFQSYLRQAQILTNQLSQDISFKESRIPNIKYEALRWFIFSHTVS